MKNQFFKKLSAVCLAGVITASMAGSIYAETIDLVTEETVDPEQVIADSENIDTSGTINILLIGQDRRQGESRGRSDSMCLLTLNQEQSYVGLTSFMRDMYVEIPGYGSNKMNAAYSYGGMELLDQTIEYNFGVSIDANVEVDFWQFAEIVDYMGGVDVELYQAEADYINEDGDRYTFNGGSFTEGTLTEGMNHLNGDQALSHCRDRHVGNSDYERTLRQRTVLTALFGKIKDMENLELAQLLIYASAHSTTDMSVEQMMAFARAAVALKDNEVSSNRIPVDGGYSSESVNGMSVLVPNLAVNSQFLAENLPQ